jgi:DNA-binding CsgD family transcriptional regulator
MNKGSLVAMTKLFTAPDPTDTDLLSTNSIPTSHSDTPLLSDAAHNVEQHDSLAESYRALFSMLNMPILLLANEGRVLTANPAAEHILRLGDGLSIRSGRLAAVASEDHQRLLSALRNAAAAKGGAGTVSRRATLPIRKSGSRAFYIVGVYSLPVSQGCSESTVPVRLAAFIVDPESRPKADLLGYQHAFGLTPAEARLAAHLVEGMSLADVAARHRISITTVRSQLRGLFSKTETHRQADLVQVLQTRSLPMG